MRGDATGWITTFTGRRIWPLDPHPNDIDIEDIAQALSNLCRFNGHVRIFYSVAEHCVRVSRACAADEAPWGLLHDASEAYLCDVTRPVKQQPEMSAYRIAEGRLQNAIYRHFGLIGEPGSVKEADDLLLRTEQRDLTSCPDWRGYSTLPEPIVPLGPRRARALFLARVDQLFPHHRRA